jgi:hypothetical protein
MRGSREDFLEVWGPYPVYDDLARLEYGRLFWRNPVMRQRLLRHWLDERHPYRERFQEYRALVEEALESSASDKELDRSFRARNTSLRCVVREIPPVFGHFWKDSDASGASLRTACENKPDS